MSPGEHSSAPDPGTLHGTAAHIASLAWEAMRDAALAREGEDRSGASADWDESLPLLWDAVWQAANGGTPTLAAEPPGNARQMLDRARRAFLDLLRSAEPCVDVREVVRVLAAMEQVQLALDRGELQPPREEKSPPTGMELLIEVAHDLRSPLTSILFLSETLRGARGRPIGSTQERQLMLIYSAAFELSSMANDLTELGRRGDHLLEQEPVPFSVDGMLMSVLDIVRPIAEEKGIEIRTSSVMHGSRLGHPSALGRVLVNLLTNALRCTEHGHVEVAVQELSQTRLEFAVLDTGPGVPPAVIESLRGPFDLKAFTRTRAFSSSGLGLAICRRLLTAMGSDLRVKVADGEGSCFHFALELPPMGEAAWRNAAHFDASGTACDRLGAESAGDE
jgi:signal transduction histidine kinase